MGHFLTFACFVLVVVALAEAGRLSRGRRNTEVSNIPLTSASSPDIYIVSPVLRRFIRSPGDPCEKKELCLLHASRNPLSAFELYFVSKDNARLWDHNSHTHTDCEKMFPDCGESASEEGRESGHQKAASAQPKPAAANFRDEDYGNDDDDDVIDDY